MKEKIKLIQKIDEAINAPTFKSCRGKLKEIREDLVNSKNEKDILNIVSKLVELLGVLAKIFFTSS